MFNHERAFRDMKDFYQEITRENLGLIKVHRERLTDIKTQIENYQKAVDDIKTENELLQGPYKEAQKKREDLRKQTAGFEKTKLSLKGKNTYTPPTPRAQKPEPAAFIPDFRYGAEQFMLMEKVQREQEFFYALDSEIFVKCQEIQTKLDSVQKQRELVFQYIEALCRQEGVFPNQ